MRLLLLTPHYPPDVAATGQLLEELAEDAVAAGHEVSVIAATPSYTEGAAKEQRRGLWRHEQRRGVDVLWLNVPRLGRRGLWSRLLPFAGYFAGAGLVAPWLRNVELVYALSTPPLLAGLVAALVSTLRRVPFVYNLQDVYPEIALALGVVHDGALARTSKTVEQFLRRRADVVTVLSEDMRARVAESTPDLRRLEVVANWIDTRRVEPLPHDRNPFRQAHGLAERFVVAYSGNLGLAHGTEILADVAAGLRDLDDVVLAVIGEGPAKADLERAVAARALSNVRFFPYQPKDHLSESLSAADVALVLQRQSCLGLVVPSKLYGVLASGRPLVAAVPQGSEVARVVELHRAGLVVPPGDAVALIAAVRQLHAERGLGHAMGARGRQAAVTLYDRRPSTARYLALFSGLSPAPASPAPRA